MTEWIYQKDAYVKQFDAIVRQRSNLGVSLNRTAFYPGGGGQPPDSGLLKTMDSSWQVSRAKVENGEIWHQIEGDLPEEGSAVTGVLDWERRYALMRTHTAMHILCGVVWRDYRASVTGGNMEPLRGRMDFEFERMQKELVAEIEQKINLEIEAARPIGVETLPREEAFEIPDLIRTKINLLPKGIQEVRVVEITGLDLQADGGTHVANTSEVGHIQVVDYKSKGKINKRIVVEIDG